MIKQFSQFCIHGLGMTSSQVWAGLTEESRKRKISAVKKRLNDKTVAGMTLSHLLEVDPAREVEGWFRKIRDTVSGKGT